jgi:hypothetical protein
MSWGNQSNPPQSFRKNLGCIDCHPLNTSVSPYYVVLQRPGHHAQSEARVSFADVHIYAIQARRQPVSCGMADKNPYTGSWPLPNTLIGCTCSCLMADIDVSDWCTNPALYYTLVQLAHRTTMGFDGIKPPRAYSAQIQLSKILISLSVDIASGCVTSANCSSLSLHKPSGRRASSSTRRSSA